MPKIFFCFFLIILSTALNACRPQRVDLRTLVPGDAIIYLETNDLSKTLNSLVENRAFQEIANDTPDFSALGNVQLAIAVTSFETSENQVTNEDSVLNFTPRFVAVAETNGWQWQTFSLIENQLDKFVKGKYGTDAGLEQSDKFGGKFFTWSAKDGRQVFAFVKGGRIYFGNDAATIEKCLTVPNGESLAKNKALERAFSVNSENRLAFGYVSSEGIKQIADLAGVSVAVETSEEAAAQSFIARILPQLLQNTTEEIVWTTNTTKRGIEDVYKISLKSEVAAITKETLTTATIASTDSFDLLPEEFFSATRYNLKNPLIAWRSLLFLTAKNTDALSGNLLISFSGALLEPYGIADAEKFLNSVGSSILTIQFDADGEKSAAMVTVKNVEDLKNAVSKEINLQTEPTQRFDAAIWFSENKQIAAALIENKFIIGESESVLSCLQAKQSGRNFAKNQNAQKIAESPAVAVTFAKDTDSVNKIVEILAKKKAENKQLTIFYTTETRFTETGFERKTISDFGLLGTILKQLKN